MDWKKWIKCAGIRALKTVAQSAIATIGVSKMMSEVDWVVVGSTAIVAGILSLLTSLAGLPEVDNDAVAQLTALVQAIDSDEENGNDD